jgi:HAD superfamily hydrolase (TIGR01509 family)
MWLIMIKGIIFDFDGLILDTETHEYEILQEIFEENNSDLPLSIWGKVVGTSSDFNPFKYLEEQTKKQFSHQELSKIKAERFIERIASEKARPGVEEYLKTAKSLALKVGLASSSNYKWVSSHLKNLGLLDKFECIKTSEDVERVKPDPTLYIEAAKCLGLKTEECLAFEDSAHGALAAKKAGMKCVIIPNKVTKDLQFCEVDHRLTSMEEIRLEELIQVLQNQFN